MVFEESLHDSVSFRRNSVIVNNLCRKSFWEMIIFCRMQFVVFIDFPFDRDLFQTQDDSMSNVHYERDKSPTTQTNIAPKLAGQRFLPTREFRGRETPS